MLAGCASTGRRFAVTVNDFSSNRVPGSEDAGTYSATVRATDNGSPNLTDDKTFTITVNNVDRPPTLSPISNMTLAAGTTADQGISASDPDGDAITFTFTGPAWMSVTSDTQVGNARTGNIHVAPPPGTAATNYGASVTATANGQASTRNFAITVTAGANQAPVLAQPADMTVNEGATADQILNATDPDGNPLSFSLASGPSFASVTTTSAGTGTATGNIHLAPGSSDAGTYAATVRASDGSLTSDRTLTITVNDVTANQAPTLTQPTDMTVDEGDTANQTLNATDPDGNPITFSLVSGPTFATVTTTTPGTGTATGNIRLQPGYLDAGTYSATVRASDNGTPALTDDKTFTITVNNTNRPPVLSQPDNMTVAENATADQIITGFDFDPEPLTFSKVSGPTFMTVTTTAPDSGNIHLAPGYLDAGTYAATVRVTDSGGLFHDRSFTITVTNVNRPPVLNSPVANMTVNEGATADQLIDASDPDGDVLTYLKTSGPSYMTVDATTGNIHLAPGFSDAGTAGAVIEVRDTSNASANTGFMITVNNVDRPVALAEIADMVVAAGSTADQVVTATDADGDAITLTAEGPVWMTFTEDPQSDNTRTGNIHLAPPLGTTGTFAASVTATANGTETTRSFTITVNPTNQAPVMEQPTDMTVDEGATADQALIAEDPDGNPLTFTKVSGPSFMTVQTLSPTLGNIHLAPGFDDAGTYAATVRATDGSLNSDQSFTITVNNVDRAPVLAIVEDMTVTAGATADQGISATDADGDAITFSFTGPAFMTVDSNAQVENTRTGNIHLAPPLGTSGTFAASVTATANGASDTENFTITVNPPAAENNPPVLTQPTNMTVNENATADQVLNATDPDGDPITFSLVTGPSFVTVTTTSAGTGTATGNVHLAPGFDDAGTYSVTVRASDNGTPALTNDKTFTITVNNVDRPPVLDAISNMTVAAGATADQGISATDPDGDAITFTFTGPAWMTVESDTQVGNTRTGNIHLAPPLGTLGTFGASVRATANGVFDTENFAIFVTPGANQAPVLAQPTNMTVNEGATLDQTLNATDPDGNPLSFTKVSGPTFMTVTTTTAGSGTATGNVHLAPGFGDSGTYAATVQASDGSLNDQKSFTITVNNIDRPPVLNAIANMTVAAGATADQGISATDPDGDAITFTFSGPAFMTVTSDTQVGNTRTGNIHLAPPAGTSGTFAASVTATANGASDTESFTITVTPSSTCQVEADASLSRDDRVIRLRSNNPSWCVTLQPASPGWQVSDIIASSIVASFGGVEIHPNSIKKVSASECGDRNDKKGKNKRKGLQVCFSKSTLRTLFASLPNGRRSVDVTITGDLAGGCEFHASVEVIVVKGNGGFAGHDDEDDDAQYGDGRFSHASPNPFNPSTTIHFELSRPGSVRLHIYDVAGRLMKTLADEFMASGAHHVTWDGTSRSGSRVASGVYFYVLETPERTVKSQLVVAK